ncbi:Abi family protein [Saccharibacillus sp. JS10]|uniref:Abi family protein n=1 Tax=Saccharibacillus sp. JS10 TaxID=2950552 RepID=UPI002109F9BE|nr:Abi family protein [Saccharibacillus sp. JS10]MCQ4087978.1 Abi family protein [Saccharibacillus sp. JS10]
MNPNIPPLKPAISLEDQIKRLTSRNLIIQDPDFAKKTLQKISYYRFTGYLLPFKTSTGNYRNGTTFEHVSNIYEFDSKLRLHLLRLCEHIEIQMRAHFSYFLAMQHVSDPLCYRNPSCFQFRSSEQFAKFITKWDENLDRSSEIFIKHHRSNYGGRFPIWVAIEVLTFSNLSTFFSNFKPSDKRDIAKSYLLKTPNLLENWLHGFSVLRNKCAHFSRLYYTFLGKDVLLSKNAVALKLNRKKLYALIFSAKYFVTDREFWSDWVNELESLVINHQHTLNLSFLGFIPNWKLHLLSKPTDTY